MLYTDNYFDNPALAILSLAIFMKSWCMDCGKADELQGQVFRCSSCPMILAEQFPEYGYEVMQGCDVCWFYDGCDGCAWEDTSVCIKNNEGCGDIGLD